MHTHLLYGTLVNMLKNVKLDVDSYSRHWSIFWLRMVVYMMVLLLYGLWPVWEKREIEQCALMLVEQAVATQLQIYLKTVMQVTEIVICMVFNKVTALWDLTSCSWVQHFRRNCCLRQLFQWRWGQYVPPKYLYLFTKLHGIKSQKIIILIFTSVGTSSLTEDSYC
jgi:hypothetical protein